MPKHDMEDIFRKKLDNFEPLHGDRWEQIATALPEKNKRRVGFWLWLGTGIALIIGLISVVLIQQTDSDIESVSNLAITEVPAGATTDNKPEPATEHSVEAETLVDITGSTKPATITEFPARVKEWTVEGIRSKQTTESGQPFNAEAPINGGAEKEVIKPIPSLTPEKVWFTFIDEGDTIKVRKRATTQQISDSLVGVKLIPLPLRIVGEIVPMAGKWSMGFGMGVFSSYFDQRMPQTQGNTAIEQQGMVQRNQILRKKMEKTGIAFSQSLWIQYQPRPNWSFNTGVSMVQSTQKLAFTIKSKVPDTYRGPADFPEIGNTGPTGNYLFSEDSILPGSGYTATNKYFSREIPFNVNYHFGVNKKFQLQITAGAAYRWVTSASVYFADIDNVGMIYMNGPEYYPGLRGTWNVQGGIALNYQINDYFSLNMMPSFQLAVQSNIRHEHYVQQYQRQWGLQVRLSRKLGF